MPDKLEITDISTLTESLRPDEIRIGKAAIIYDVRMAAHRSKLHQIAPSQYLRIDTFVALKMELVL